MDPRFRQMAQDIAAWEAEQPTSAEKRLRQAFVGAERDIRFMRSWLPWAVDLLRSMKRGERHA